MTANRWVQRGRATVDGSARWAAGATSSAACSGRGGMAEVRKGTDVRLGRGVAVKLLRTDLARDPTFQARFRREAQSPPRR